CMQALEFPPF
nr:immunoglobulin light chain junction region [Macaca mulatta]